uniref:Uncharacterized protein n=1 Tax=Photinus pyralis TaxID=7054 RepID=A0A1Y1MU68_PHOPY
MFAWLVVCSILFRDTHSALVSLDDGSESCVKRVISAVFAEDEVLYIILIGNHNAVPHDIPQSKIIWSLDVLEEKGGSSYRNNFVIQVEDGLSLKKVLSRLVLSSLWDANISPGEHFWSSLLKWTRGTLSCNFGTTTSKT